MLYKKIVGRTTYGKRKGLFILQSQNISEGIKLKEVHFKSAVTAVILERQQPPHNQLPENNNEEGTR